jgi:hypothetical protein
VLGDHIQQQEEKDTMADPRFFQRFGPFRLDDIAAEVGAELLDPSTKDIMICDIASLETAGPESLSRHPGICRGHDPRLCPERTWRGVPHVR